ncbi:MAG: FAD-dependent monooxygenase [Clostridiales bacterium]|nr:FAD-dependent monooxygenase [Clostridiales bacterium]
MIQINNIKLPPDFSSEILSNRLKKNRIPENAEWKIHRLSLDARKKDNLHYLCSVQASFPGEAAYIKKNRNPDITLVSPGKYQMPEQGKQALPSRPIIIGAGPAGLFAGRLLAEAGYAPILLERGASVEERTKDVHTFWETGSLLPDSNVQFGEGGAGTFSDGKLNTQVKDRFFRIRQTLEWFVEAGADPSILYWNKPHIGTDVLTQVVRNLREKIISLGGEVHFHSCVTGFQIDCSQKDGPVLEAIQYRDSHGQLITLEAGPVILAIGHSARDTFAMLEESGIPMESKSFAVGLRIEHPQSMIQASQYGEASPSCLPAADYKLTAQTKSGRGVYSFCMCPGGQVVNASSEPERTVVNGMSLSARNGRNANSALVVTVTPRDYPGTGPLAGVQFQRNLEHLAWLTGQGKIPSQLLADFHQNTSSTIIGQVEPDIFGGYQLGNLREVLPDSISQSILEAMPEFGRKIRGYDRKDAVLSGVESRTSSPVKILRGEHFESSVKGLFPCGEGAGYAGGITSAAVDGIKVAEEIIRRYQPWT